MKKIICNCPCPGPYCQTLTHPCSKPDEHYPQRDKEYNNIYNQALKDVEEKVSTEAVDNFGMSEEIEWIWDKLEALKKG